jgi:hypothetical protein
MSVGFGVLAADPPSAGAAVSYTIRGTISCNNGQAISGIYMNKTGSGDGFITNRQMYPGRTNVAIFHHTFSATLPINVQLSVGCGSGSTPGSWLESNNGPPVAIASGTARNINLWCGGNSCNGGNVEDNNPAAPSSNRFGNCWCTHLAADKWKEMTGRFPNWSDSFGSYGNAESWDTRAANTAGTDWTVSSVARPRSLVVFQPTPTNPAGHVGQVIDVRVRNGVVEMLVTERNWDDSCSNGTQTPHDRTDWRTVSTSNRFIVPWILGTT